MLKQEWKKLLGNKMMMVVIVAIIAIPTIYTTLFLGSMWDPYGNTDKLPVAVVNEDVPAKYGTTTLHVGKEMVENLKKDGSLDFTFTDQETAEKGLKDGTYYMVITIPETFSAHAATLTDETPAKMELLYETNPGTNYIASKMSETAMQKVESSIREEVTKSYANALFDQIKTAGDGMQKASDGAAKLQDGSEKLADGNQTIETNLKVLADSTLVFRTGSKTLKEGLAAYTEGVAAADDGIKALDLGAQSLSRGAVRLNDGIGQLNAKLPLLASGADTLSQGTSRLDSGIKDAGAGSEQLKSGTVQVHQNLTKLTEGLTTLSDQSSSLPDSARALADGTDTLYQKSAQISQGIGLIKDQMLPSIDQNIDQVRGGIQTSSDQIFDSVSQNTVQIKQQIDQLLTKMQQEEACLSANTQTSDISGVEATIQSLKALSDALDKLHTQTTTAKTQFSTNVSSSMEQLKTGINATAEKELDRLKEGAAQLETGSKALSQETKKFAQESPVLVAGINDIRQNADLLKTSGTQILVEGSDNLSRGLSQLAQGSTRLDQGVQGLAAQVPALLQGAQTLSNGSAALTEGAQTLKAGTEKISSGTSLLTGKNRDILNGINQLDQGALKLNDGATKLHSGSQTLGKGLLEVQNGSETLKESLKDGAEKIQETPMDKKTEEMFAAPVETSETQITTVENNGHAMAPYMMSVALWVGCIAFSLMYPLTRYSGRLKSGFAWWGSKASVLYPVAILQAVVMIGLLHVCNGFTPAEMGKTIAFACLASVTFMSVMYFFTNTLGKAGSFLMLIFMVIQLAGSVGTYPLELSGSFVPYLHDWVPFTYTVEAFRSTISGGESIRHAVIFLAVIWILFTILTIVEFQIRASKIKKGKPILESWLEEKGLA